MSFQTRKTSVHLRNTNDDIFDAFWELSDPPIDRNGINTMIVQKRSKEIGKIAPHHTDALFSFKSKHK